MNSCSTIPDGWSVGHHEGYYTKTIKVGNCTVEINRPILTPEEQKKREDQVIEALKRFGKETQYGS